MKPKKTGILLVDDELRNLKLLKGVLAGMGLNLVCAESGEEALRHLQRKSFAAILLDIKMPGLNGFGTASLIREREETRKTPIIFITACGENKELENLGFSYGAVDYIAKPFDPEELRSKVRNLILLSKKTESIERNIRENVARKNGKNILLVDDSPENQVAMKSILEILGYKLISASSAHQATIFIRTMEIALVFLHLHLPNSGTPALVNFLRNPDFSFTPLICVGSMQTASEDVSYAYSLGIGDLLFTPFKPAIVGSKIFGVIQNEKEKAILESQVSEIQHLSQELVLSEAKLRNLNETLEKRVEERTESLKAVQEQLMRSQKLEALGNIAAGIAHDFNNILSSILGLAEMLKLEKDEPEKLSAYADEIIMGANLAKEIIQQIKDFGGNLELKLETFRLRKIVKEVLDLKSVSFPANVSVRQSFSSPADFVHADPNQVSRVIMNLCANALYAMRETGGTLTLNIDSVEIENTPVQGLKRGPYIRLSVSDTGIGVEKASLHRIFEPYFTTKKMGEGTGLGLAVALRVVTQHGGTITFQSEPGKGATFFMYLPMARDFP